MSVDLKAIRERNAQAKGLLITGMRGGKTLLANALADRAQLLALVDQMLDRIAEARAAIIAGDTGALDALNAAVSDAMGEAALLRKLEEPK